MFQVRPSKRDVQVILCVLLVAVLLMVLPLLLRQDGRELIIMTDEGFLRYDLSEDTDVTVKNRGVTLTVCIRDGVVYVADSSCPDGICKKGRLERAGESILCAPAGVTLKITGGDGDVDFVAG